MRLRVPLLSLPLLLALTACGPEGTVSVEDPGSTDQGRESPGKSPSATPSTSAAPTGEPSADSSPGEAAFGESHRVPFPVGAYEHEYEGEADVVYTVGDVSSSGAGRVDFTLEVEVPRLGRVLGLNNLEAVCEAGAGEVAAESTDPPGEAEAGSHAFPMWCDTAPGPEELRITVRHGGEEMVFAGPVG
jgi:hypothetical protein